MNRKLSLSIVVVLAALATVPLATATKVRMLPYRDVISKVASMVSNGEARRLASRHGLQVLNVLWEDTGRWQGSSVGPNISDVTIEVADGVGPARRRALMPVIRFPNFRDKTADVRLDKFFLRIGNQREGGRLEVISLREFLARPLKYLSLPEKGSIKGKTLLAERDTHALVSAQAAFLPVPRHGKATFYPVIFNYQSTAKNPAVLTILVTRQGTSLTVVDNARDTVTGGASWGQRLFYNSGGRRAPLTAERLSDVQERGTTSNGESSASLGEDANLLMLIQVPLKHRAPRRWLMAAPSSAPAGGAVYKSAKPVTESARQPDIEVAVLGHGEEEGPYTELDGLSIERDPRFPVRVTVQFYQATSDGRLDDANMTRLSRQISDVYEKGDYVGSLVVPAPSDIRRPTNWHGIGPAPKHLSLRHFPGLLERYQRFGILFPFFLGLQ